MSNSNPHTLSRDEAYAALGAYEANFDHMLSFVLELIVGKLSDQPFPPGDKLRDSTIVYHMRAIRKHPDFDKFHFENFKELWTRMELVKDNPGGLDELRFDRDKFIMEIRRTLGGKTGWRWEDKGRWMSDSP